ncbi:MAG: alpha-glucosidase [Sphaerochaetaceae bacterium]|nr:alpha-glucosidase [Sphaerochaetaceae bacterium]
MIACTMDGDRLVVAYDDLVLIDHGEKHPFIMLGVGSADIDMYRGNYFFSEQSLEKRALCAYSVTESLVEGVLHYQLRFGTGDAVVCCSLFEQDGRLHMEFEVPSLGYNRLLLRFHATDDEHVYGCGEQFSFFDLRGRHFPLWTQEQGVGRNKLTAITQIADREDRAGGDYHTTFHPQPTFVSSRGYFLHAETYGYADFDFSCAHSHNLMFWDVPSEIVVGRKPSLLETVQDVSAFLGRQKELPDWCYDGVILGVQGGTETCLRKLEAMCAAGVSVCGIWAQDWVGEKLTSFGKRLRWNWQWDSSLYPGLDSAIEDLKSRSVRFLGYINPYVLEGFPLFEQAKAAGYLALTQSGDVYLVDFGEFLAGIVDFTNPGACRWYQDVIRRELIDFGLSGWMADFGEYLPTDCVLSDGSSPMLMHNAWPGLWAQVNHDAVASAGMDDEILYFMRAGNARSLSACPMMWGGDQNVDWSEDDGLPSALTGALSLAMSGMGLCHSDIGGYTTLYGMSRTKELLLRWCEFAAFTPLMRTHEGNRPKENWQFDGDEQTVAHFARMTALHVALKPYMKELVSLNSREGIPVMRPVFLHYPEEMFYKCKDAYMLGRDLFVAPVLEPAASRSVLLPDDAWIHLFTGEEFAGGYHLVAAPFGRPPVFYRKDSSWKELFAGLRVSCDL